MHELKKEINANIINGIATVLWGDAWAQHIENARDEGRGACRSLSGVKIEDVMPEIPKAAKQRAMLLARAYGKANGEVCVADLLVAAYRADECFDEDYLDEDLLNDVHELDSYQEEFGNNLAWMAMGHGVSWFDDHEDFPLEVPHVENYDLQMWATDHCEDCTSED